MDHADDRENTLTKHAAAVSARETLTITVEGPPERLPLSPDCEEHLYRIGQEALANVTKHARAEHARVTVTSDADLHHLEVPDDGGGFDARRKLCPDGACVGVIGEDGRCKVCGQGG